MILKQLLERLEYEVVQGSDKIEITTLINDSRKVEEGSVFVCISGAVSDGHQYVADVAKKGAKAVIELLKHEITPEIYQHLVASYAIGYTITQEELDSYPYLRMAKDSTDVGVIIGFNSVTKSEAISPLFKNNIVCINPLNWKTDASPGVSYQGFTASIAPSIHTIVVTGIDEDKYYIPSVEVLLPKGNLHVEEFNLYNQNLRKNVLQRIRAFHERSFQSN